MQKLSEVYRGLALSTLKGTGAVTDDRLGIEPDSKPEILAAINEGLVRLHSRFPLKTNNCIVEMKEGRTDYPLHSKYAYSRFTKLTLEVQYPYIMDGFMKPFQDDVIKILNVFDNSGNRRRLNDYSDPRAIFTPRPDTIQCMRPRHFEALNVTYQAKHPVLTGDEEQEVDLADTLMTALHNWVGYRYHTGLNTTEANAKAAEYLQTYESICGEVVDYDLANGSMSNTNVLFEKRGWV